MGLDPFSPIAPARLNVLLLPVGKITHSRFLGFVARLESENVVRLGDVSPDGRPNRNMFSPLAFPTGMILFNLSTSTPAHPHLDLFPFEVFRDPLAVLAVADGREIFPTLVQESERQEQLANEEEKKISVQKEIDHLLIEVGALKEQYTQSLVHQLLLFDSPSANLLANAPQNVMLVASPETSKTTTLKTVMCDITSLILAEMTDFAKNIQDLPSIASPKAVLEVNETGRGSSFVDRVNHRMTMPAQLPSRTSGLPSQSVGSGAKAPIDRGKGSPTTFDEIARSIDKSSRASSVLRPGSRNGSKEHSRERMSIQAQGSVGAHDRIKHRGKARVGMVIGSLYLQTGRWPDALKELVESAGIARANSDYLWHGKALENILLCMLLFAWAGMDFQIPQICYPIADKSVSSAKSASQTPTGSTPDVTLSGQTSSNRLVSLQNLTNLLPDLLNTILNLYTRAANFTDEELPQLAFSETVIRFASLLASLQVRDGLLDDHVLKHVVSNELLTPARNLERPRGSVSMRKSEIAALLFRAMPPSSDELTAMESISILVGMTSVLSTLNLLRKKTFVLRELLLTLIPGLVQARKVGAAEMGIHPAAGLSALTVAGLSMNALDHGPARLANGLRALLGLIGEIHGVTGSGTGTVREPFGNATATVNSVNHEDQSTRNDDLDSIEAITARNLRSSSLRDFGNLSLKIDILKSCINFCEALPDFQGVLQFNVELLHTTRRAVMLPVNSAIGSSALPQEEQIRLLNNIRCTTGAAKRLGGPELLADYWDDFLIRGVWALEPSRSKKPTPHSRRELDLAGAIEEGSKTGPFIYNPFAKASTTTAELLLVAEELASFSVVLQNPFDFDVEIERLCLESEGAQFKSISQSFVVGPCTMHTQVVSGIAKTSGALKITGCKVKVRCCRERRFPIFQKPWKPPTQVKQKRMGLAAREQDYDGRLSTGPETTGNKTTVTSRGPKAESLSITVINAQPRLMVKSTSLPQSAIMVLEGETRSFQIALQNISTRTPIDLLLFTFQDSTTKQLQAAMSNKDISPAELYELELQLSTRAALRLHRENEDDRESHIQPGQTSTFTVEVLGKPGLLEAVIQIDYAHLGIPRSDIKDKFFTRQILLPITITVNAGIEMARCDILPFSSDFAWANQQRQQDHHTLANGSIDCTPSQPGKSKPRSRTVSRTPPTHKDSNQFAALLSRLGLGSHGTDHCLLLLDVRNAWPSPLSISLQVREATSRNSSPSPDDPWRRAYTAHETLQPGHLSRLVLLLPRIFLPDPHASIPLLGNQRQYVVSTNKISTEAEATNREAFWFREELLKLVRGSWREGSSGREGDIELRGIRLNARMVDAMRVEDVEIGFSVTALPDHSSDRSSSNDDADEEFDPPITQSSRSKFLVRTHTFLTLLTTIHNRTSQPILPLLRLQPSLRNQPHNIALDLSKRMAWTGVLQRAIGEIGAGETREVKLGVTALCAGEYEWGASVEEVRVWKPPVGADEGERGGEAKEKKGIGVGDGAEKRERRIWHSREACIIVARD